LQHEKNDLRNHWRLCRVVDGDDVMGAGFTKGPWSVHPEIPFAVEPAICECFGRTVAEANAHLIASAPELYEALVRFSDARNAYLESDHGSASERIAAGKLDEAHELADRVIAKARGEVTHTPIGDEM
jgi:hypothetical protein